MLNKVISNRGAMFVDKFVPFLELRYRRSRVDYLMGLLCCQQTPLGQDLSYSLWVSKEIYEAIYPIYPGQEIVLCPVSCVCHAHGNLLEF